KDRTQFHSIINTAYLSKSNAYWKLIDSLKISTIPANLVDSLRPEEQKKAYELAINNARNVMSMAESKVTEINAEEEGVRRFQIEFWRKYTFSFACLIMFFIGAPLGAIIRKGGLGMPVVISVVFFIVFWVISITGEKLSKDGAVPPEYGMWLGCLIYLPIGIWLTKKATADSSLFDIDSYKNILRKLNVLRYKREQKLITRQFGDHQNTGQK
ncbi:MAG TPA: LptF/LptG family permease, partial [Bacteroidia bacterium]|nr:LptF/LptG family permease [Bacteroidia bacterium]